MPFGTPSEPQMEPDLPDLSIRDRWEPKSEQMCYSIDMQEYLYRDYQTIAVIRDWAYSRLGIDLYWEDPLSFGPMSSGVLLWTGDGYEQFITKFPGQSAWDILWQFEQGYTEWVNTPEKDRWQLTTPTS